MKLTRRHVLVAFLSPLLWALPWKRKAVGATGTDFLSSDEFSALSGFIDILIPADDGTPAASSLHVPRAVVDAAARDRRVQRILAMGCRRLNNTAKTLGVRNFSALREQSREDIVEATAAPGAAPLPKAFFTIVRDLSMRAYYAHAAAWGGLGYAGPPQPDGFIDYRDAPKSGAK